MAEESKNFDYVSLRRLSIFLNKLKTLFMTKDEAQGVAYIYTEENEDVVFTDEINQQIIAAVNSALASAKASGQFDGQDGETPVKGEDYWTTTDKNEIIEAVLARIPVGNEVEY